MPRNMDKTVLLICDMWDDHWCADMRRRMGSLIDRINDLAKVVRQHGGRVLHCPSDTVDSYYGDWPQRQAMRKYPLASVTVSEKMRPVRPIFDIGFNNGCPDAPQCRVHVESTKQHDGIEILPEDLISESGQEVYNFLVHEKIECVLISGLCLNMCVLGRPFGIQALSELGVTVRIVSDLVEVGYAPFTASPYATVEQAKWLALGFIQADWGCTITTCHREVWERETTLEANNMRIHSNIPGPLVARLKRQYNLKYFVETGTAYGDTLELAAILFDKVWSCDIDQKLVGYARNRLKDYLGDCPKMTANLPDVEVAVEPSPQFLRRIQPKLTQPTLYWLDAHWCGGPKPAWECPLLDEIKAIGSFKGNSIVVIDDVNLMENPPPPPHDPKQWPTMPQIQVAFNRWKEPYQFEHHQGSTSRVLIAIPKTLVEG